MSKTNQRENSIENRSAPGSHSRRDLLGIVAVSAVGLTLPDHALSAVQSAAAHEGVSGPLQSAGVLAFGHENVLFVGDIRGAAVHDMTPRNRPKRSTI
jgi:hypothetical protein